MKATRIPSGADGDLSSDQVRADADGAGHAWRTVERAQKELGIKPYKKGMKEGWFWTLEGRRPPRNTEDRHKNSWRSSGNDGGLRDGDGAPFEEF